MLALPGGQVEEEGGASADQDRADGLHLRGTSFFSGFEVLTSALSPNFVPVLLATPVLSMRRVFVAQVAVSKLFPAGFGWQYSSGIAEETFGLGANDVGFFVVTGLGDFCGVFAGHFTYYTAKRILYDPSIRVGEQAHVALWLAAAAFASGGMWQPFVNFFQACSGEGNHFNSHVMATVAGCGTMFYGGLRLGRYFLAPVLTGIPKADYNNLRADAQLSVAIGGATGCFVGTDISYGDGNWLRPLIGVEEGFGNIHGCALAGTSTALGFTAVQIAENIVRFQSASS